MKDALAAIRAHTDLRPEIALVLGSGLGALADEAEDAVVVPTGDIPGYPASTVVGHAGRLVFGRLEGRDVLFVQGRAHYYEGHDMDAVTFPVRLAHALGARHLLLTNAAGGINPDFPPGTLMLITDHLNLAAPGVLPLLSGDAAVVGAFRGSPYDAAWADEAERVALARRVAYRKGVYVWASGPSYETPAEIRFFRHAGADAVGMSTVPEALQGAALGMRVLGLSTVTNPAAGLATAPLNHDEVLEVGRAVRERLATWVRGIVAGLTV